MALSLVGLLALNADYTIRMSPTVFDGPVPQAVVFTGQFDRIRHGLELLDSGLVKRLLVSGVNPGAGLTPERFIALFAPDAQGLHIVLASGRLELGLAAADTFGNALETASWYQRSGLSGPLLLITSPAHMPRASVALSSRLPDVDIRRAPVTSLVNTTRAWRHEFPRYLATRLLVLVHHRRAAECPGY
ncbi:MAG: YdcF family protein [Rhodobacterales bacterium]